MAAKIIPILSCQETRLLLTEYSRNQLNHSEMEAVKKHLDKCPRCFLENELFKDLTGETDKIIPVTNLSYKRELISEIFVKERDESPFVKTLAVFLLLFLLFSLFSGIFSQENKYFPTFGEMIQRAEKMFDLDPAFRTD